ncbi:NHL repeat-containing protein [Ramlibacter alkalitolerans]|uniref:6-bladed beta-propeller n=1 Tax=Ramlibacter alkalitolerans TaxID=2039631 RepID=A0ABS1JIV6_9BURK|nr:6-bladed beta-propeller [Ramlibacter alkalitolerans]MBL0424165.1 6-bladed beta-propeller [Ramlibacter alkalitolerans]
MLRWVVPALAAALLAGCAVESRVLQLDGSSAGERLFPAPQTQETPRYRYLGQLQGETNFKLKDGQAGRSSGRKLLALIAGLSDTPDRPVMLVRPQAGMVDPAGRVLVTDVGRGAVFVFDEAAGRLDVWEMATRGERFVAPIGIALGRGGEILVADSELGRVFRLSPDGKPLGEFGAGVLQRPTGVVRDAARARIFVADTYGHEIDIFDDEGRAVAKWGERGDGPGQLNFPTHLALSGELLIVSDSMNARVQGFDPAGKPVLRFGERGLYVGNLVRPKGVAADDEGNLYVVESMHDTLLVFDREGRLLMSLGGSDAENGRFYLPAGVWVDGRNRVFVADMFNGRVAVFQFLGGN